MGEIHRDGKYLHIDVSGGFYQKNMDTGVACVSSDGRFHIGTTLSQNLKRQLRQKLKTNENYPQLHAILIHHLLSKVKLSEYIGIIFCNDPCGNFQDLIMYLDELFKNNESYAILEKTSIDEIRVKFGNRKIKSLADNKADSYRKRGNYKIKHNDGVQLNYVSFELIRKKWR